MVKKCVWVGVLLLVACACPSVVDSEFSWIEVGEDMRGFYGVFLLSVFVGLVFMVCCFVSILVKISSYIYRVFAHVLKSPFHGAAHVRFTQSRMEQKESTDCFVWSAFEPIRGTQE